MRMVVILGTGLGIVDIIRRIVLVFDERVAGTQYFADHVESALFQHPPAFPQPLCSRLQSAQFASRQGVVRRHIQRRDERLKIQDRVDRCHHRSVFVKQNTGAGTVLNMSMRRCPVRPRGGCRSAFFRCAGVLGRAGVFCGTGVARTAGIFRAAGIAAGGGFARLERFLQFRRVGRQCSEVA